MIKASELKKGFVVLIDAHRLIVKDIQIKSPTSRGSNTLYKITYRNLATKLKVEKTYKGDDSIQEVEFIRRAVQLSFRESDSCTFMDDEDYNQYTISNDSIEDELPYLTDGLEGIVAFIADGELIGIDLPSSVDLEIIECSPGIKGASASARTKPATLSTGLVVNVPEYLTVNEVIKVNTSTGKFVSRA